MRLISDRTARVDGAERRTQQQDVDDRTLLRACAHGDRSALHELYRRHGATVYNAATVIARQRIGSPTPEDLTVAAFTTLWAEAADVVESRRPVLGQLLRCCGRSAVTA